MDTPTRADAPRPTSCQVAVATPRCGRPSKNEAAAPPHAGTPHRSSCRRASTTGPSTKVRLGATHHTPSRHAPRDTTPHPPRRNTRHTQTDTETAGRGDTVFPRSTAARVSTPECPHQGRYASLPRSACGRPLTRPPGRRNPAAVRDQGKDRTEHGHNPRPEPPETDHSRPCPGATHQVSHRRARLRPDHHHPKWTPALAPRHRRRPRRVATAVGLPQPAQSLPPRRNGRAGPRHRLNTQPADRSRNP